MTFTAVAALRFRETDEARWLRLAALAAALACLQRYVGVVFAVTTAAWLLFASRGRGARTWPHAIAFAVAALLPVALWMLRNLVVGEEPSGERDESDRSLATNTSGALRTLTGFFAPDDWLVAIRFVPVGGFALVALGGGLGLLRREPGRLDALVCVAALPAPTPSS